MPWNWRAFADDVLEGALIGVVAEVVQGDEFTLRLIAGTAAGGALTYVLKWWRSHDV